MALISHLQFNTKKEMKYMKKKTVSFSLIINGHTYTRRMLTTLAKKSKQSVSETARRLINKALLEEKHEQSAR